MAADSTALRYIDWKVLVNSSHAPGNLRIANAFVIMEAQHG
jgi:hypothetical protein